MKKENFISTIAPIVQKINKKHKNKLFSSVVIAQAICESAWGQSKMMMNSNAIFGIKATKTWKGKVYSTKTNECYDGINMTKITALFRAYNSLEESIEDYFNLILKSTRYKKALNCKNYEECITAIKNGGYATDPNYILTICNIIKTNNLIKYDNEIENNINKEIDYKIGNNYKLLYDVKIRSNSDINSKQKLYKDITKYAKEHSYIQKYAILKKGTTITCQKVVKKVNGDIWIKISSGYVCAKINGNKLIG